MWYLLILIPVVIFFVYLYTIFPARGKRAKSFSGLYIAHRGFHSQDVPENTLKAFSGAIDRGYGIELDVRLSLENTPVVCHDADLKRVFSCQEKVSEISEEDLAKIGVPSLKSVLELVSGEVPLVIELKGNKSDKILCEKTAELLDKYDGKYCIESFNPLHLKWFRKNRPNIIRGQLSTRFKKNSEAGGLIINFMLRHLLLNFISRPDFIAYEHIYADSFSLRLCALFGAEMFCWTPRNIDEANKAKKRFKTFIFENFEP